MYKSHKRRWTDQEQEAVKQSLGKYLFVKSLPGKREIDECLSRHPVLCSRSWLNVKDFVRNSKKIKH
jgi:hypothetical protein